jgi:hypothetical protein
MSGVVALGVSVEWARPGPADFTPLLAMGGAVLILRFVIRVPLTGLRTMMAAASGAMWAAAVGSWGFTFPTLVALAAVALLSATASHPRPS